MEERSNSMMAIVSAEEAPIGVLLWPVVSAGSEPHYTLAEVQVVRREERSFVRWIYQDGKERTFEVSEGVVGARSAVPCG